MGESSSGNASLLRVSFVSIQDVGKLIFKVAHIGMIISMYGKFE